MGYFLALDAGGTKTECWLADDDRVLASGRAQTVKLMIVGAEEATARLDALLKDVSGRAGVRLDAVTRTCMGLAGISSEGVREWAETTIRERVAGELILAGDEEIALQAAFGDGPGVLVISGTGSNVVGRCSNGTRMTAGGWGPMLGDEGSGHWIGIEAIRSALRARDRGVPTCLIREIMAYWKLDGVGALIAKANHRPRPDFAPIAELVASCAAEGDVLATSVLERAGQELAAQTSIVFSKMLAAGCSPSDMQRVAYTGSVLGEIATVRAEMSAALKHVRADVEIDEEPVRPIEGALARARQG